MISKMSPVLLFSVFALTACNGQNFNKSTAEANVATATGTPAASGEPSATDTPAASAGGVSTSNPSPKDGTNGGVPPLVPETPQGGTAGTTVNPAEEPTNSKPPVVAPPGGNPHPVVGPTNCEPPAATDPGQGNLPEFGIPTYDVCSSQAIQWTGTTVTRAPGVQLKLYELRLDSSRGPLVVSEVGLPSGTYDKVALKHAILEDRRIPIPQKLLSSGHHYTAIICSSDVATDACQLSVNPSNASDLNHFPNALSLSDFILTPSVLGPFNYEMPGQQLQVFHLDKMGKIEYQGEDKYGSMTILYDVADKNDDRCEGKASPLIIDTLNPAGEAKIELSPREQGAHFDITGNGGRPLISWPTHPEKDMFLVLPNAQQKVLGIAQLFGNNTRGPDGKKSANGFAALAKYVGAGQSTISAQDPIFGKLRLWSDVNRDGLVQDGELFTLASKSITSIQLNYQAVRINLNDGNELRQQSTAIQNGLPLGIFDLWFQLP
jgi:hypothetical protein